MCLCMHIYKHTCVGMNAHCVSGSEVDTWYLFEFPSTSFMRQGLSLNPRLTSSVSPATQLAPGILCFGILSAGVEGCCHACLTVRQILGI